MLDFSAMWCGPCNMAAQTQQEIQDRYEDQGFQYATILIADSQDDVVHVKPCKNSLVKVSFFGS